MKWKVSGYLAIIAVLMALVGCGSKPGGKAAELMELEMFEEAQSLLIEEISKSPKVAELHRMLGVCYLCTERPEKAKESFDRTMALDPQQGEKIGTAYLDFGAKLLATDSFSGAHRNFEFAMEYDPELAASIGRKLFEYGAKCIPDEQWRRADRALSDATVYDSELNSEVASLFLAEGGKALHAGEGKHAIQLFERSVGYMPEKSADIAGLLIEAMRHSLADGNLAEAGILAEAAVDFDEEARATVSSEIFENAKAKLESGNWRLISNLGELAIQIDTSNSAAWGALAFEVITPSVETLSASELVSACQQFLEWDPSLKGPIVDLYFRLAGQELAKRGFETARVEPMLSAAVAIDEKHSARAGKEAWIALNARLSDLSTLGKDRFVQLFGLCSRFQLNSDFTGTVEYRFATALQLYVTGGRKRAIRLLTDLSREAPETDVGRQALAVLALPEPGVRVIQRKPISVDGMKLELTEVDVGSNSLSLRFVARAQGRKELLYIPEAKEIKFGVISGNELLHLRDDNGKKLLANDGFKGGVQEEFNRTVQSVVLPPNTDVSLSVSFPMVSPGATRITFISPKLDGWQGEWSIRDIVLKKGPFD